MSPAPDALFIAFQAALAGRYSLDRELGRGGMGIVYLAREVRLDRLVAIKLLPPERAADEVIRERFVREARTAAKLSHPNIIPIHSVEEVDDFVYFVMSYIDGETLTQRVQSRGPLPASHGARVLREVAWALAYAHGQGLVHRDVKPDNILLETESGRAIDADFGIAANAADTGTSGVVTGTPEFMSPEQAMGEPLDARSDLYSLGATAFYMFSGRFPFEGRSPTEIIAQHVAQSPPPVASLGRPVPRKLATMIDRCLSKNPGDRPANGQVLAEQLNAALEQRRELPVALTSFLKVARLDGRGTLAGAASVLGASVVAASLYGWGAGWTALFGTAVLLPVASWVAAARRLLLNGFDHSDIPPAFNTTGARAREERGETLPRASRMERVLRWYTLAAPVSLALYRAVTFGPPIRTPTYYHVLQYLWQTFDMFMITQVYLPIVFSSGVLSGIAALALAGDRRDVDSRFWSRLWSGRFGKLVFGLARRLPGTRVRYAAVTHRATELSLAVAAEELFAHLPKASREALSDLPVALRRLQDGAQVLRKEIDRLQDALNDAGGAAMSEDFAAIRETRDVLSARHREAVAELETLRLGLLRLHAGVVSVESITTHLKLAAEVSEHVERLISARGEMEHELNYPRPEIPSPV
jgi:hypothetical protein